MFNSSRQFNPISKVGGYLSNIGKEAKQYGSAWTKSVGASYDAKTYPPASVNPPVSREQKAVEASKANAAEKSALGQLAGAVLQGRRYNDKTGKQIKGK